MSGPQEDWTGSLWTTLCGLMVWGCVVWFLIELVSCVGRVVL